MGGAAQQQVPRLASFRCADDTALGMTVCGGCPHVSSGLSQMRKAKNNTRTAGAKRVVGARGKVRKPVDLQAVRQQISDLVGSQALNLVEITIAEADKGHYGAMKYLFEMIGLYPASGEEAPPQEDSLAKTLLRRLGMPEDAEPAGAGGKESTQADGGNAVE